MSAFIVSKDQIEVLVAAGVHATGEEDREHASKVGQALLDECVRSVSYRYPDDDLGELPGSYVVETVAPGIAPVEFAEWITPYTFRGERLPDREEVADTIGCYEYQSCEHPEWESSWAHSYCQRLRQVLHSLPAPAPVVEAPAHDYGSLDRNETIKRIRQALKRRSGKAWSVTGGRGTAWGWITITAPPKRCVDHYYMTEADQRELGELLGKDRPVHCQGESIPASSEYRREYIDRAEGRTPTIHGTPYWD